MNNLYIRWLIKSDLSDVLDIENKCFPDFPWSEDDYIRCLRQRNRIGMCADLDEKVVGLMIYELHKSRLHLLNFAVHPDYQRKKIASAMIAKLTAKLSPGRRNRIMLEVREKNLAAQLFFRSMGFRAISVLRGFYEDAKEDAYLMQYKVAEEMNIENNFAPKNRISSLISDDKKWY